ncbi:MAG TPA: tetratricopeptide repeat-containing glycosyltransferase family protein [Rhodopila sp.]|jgi:tetratricopeptide (TPR) repeat protein|nr:tetratricopeptide repeat-containing glycosyltransferase family protein [Rhodopila sp.]
MPLMPISRPNLTTAQPGAPLSHSATRMMHAVGLHDEGRYVESLALFEQLLREEPNRYDLLTWVAILRAQLGAFSEALLLLEASLRMAPDQSNAHNARAICLYKLSRFEEAIAAFERAAELGLNAANRNKSTVLTTLGRFEEANAYCDLALQDDPNDATVYHDKAMPLFAMRRFDEVLAALDKSLELKPGYAEAYFNKALLLLAMGDFTNGWDLFEWRWRMEEARAAVVQTRQRVGRKPLWLGDRIIEGKTILLHAEQGFGDTFQFLRFVPYVTALGAKVILQVPVSMKRLAASLDCDCTILTPADELPPIDMHCPLMSLAKALNLQPGRIPAPRAYLRADPALLSAWSERLGPWRRPRIGLVWFGSMLGGLPNLKSMAFEDITSLTNCDADFFALQKSPRPEDLVFQRNEQVWDLGEELGDFADTAAAMTLMDLIISVDTGPAHLAGALGRPLWIMLPSHPEWRWPDGETTPWYPSARQFWQPAPSDWATPLAEVRAALRTWIPTIRGPE